MRTVFPSRLATSATGLTLALFCGSSLSAQELYVGGADTLFMQGDPVAGNFQIIGACGGSIQSMVESYQDLYLGDVSGRVYQYFGQASHPSTGSTTYVFDSPNDASTLADYGGSLLVGGSDGTVHMINKLDGSVEETFNATVAVSAMTRVGRTLYVAAPDVNIMEIDLLTGSVAPLGGVGAGLQSMTDDGDHLVIGTSNGVIYRMLKSTGVVEGAFGVPNDATALLMHGGDLIVGGSDGSILRVNATSGAVLGTLSSLGSDVSALAMGAQAPEPGWPYCYGLECPCGNDDPLSGCSNSLGIGARMFASGSNSFLADDMLLTVDQMPPGAFAVNYMGALTNNISFGDGKLCTGNGYPIFRYQIQNSGQAGEISLGPGLIAHSHANFGAQGHINPGSTWLWQIWYRNPAGPCGTGFNTSNGYVVTFAP